MYKHIAIEDIEKVLSKERRLPTAVYWNRLEGRPRTRNFDRALKAEIRDPLWMLTKQWQMGEFHGDDAGSPIFAKIQMATSRLNKYKPGNGIVHPFEKNVPLEAKVEQRALPFLSGSQEMSLNLRLLMGRQWLKMVATIDGDYKQQYIKKFAIETPSDTEINDVQICGHKEVWQQYAAVAGRSMDGGKLYFHLKNKHKVYDGINVAVGEKIKLDEIAEKFLFWFENLFYQSEGNNDAWKASQLEYQFDCSSSDGDGEKVFHAEEYYHGHLDWYNLDIDKSQKSLGEIENNSITATDIEERTTSSLIPTSVEFDGMPNTRWWSFEDGKTNFGDINPDTTDLNKLLLIEFGLVYANDWFIVPFTLPVGSVAQVKGMVVTNVFGERTWIDSAGKGLDDDWNRWSMFSLSIRGHDDEPADLTQLLLPTVPKIQESEPVEEVYLIRDEIANMVWGIETKVPLPTGRSKPGREAAIELHNHYQRILDNNLKSQPLPPADSDSLQENEAKVRYQIMSSVPENWVPFIPVHVDGNNREIQLQRAAMPRILVGDANNPEKIRPRTNLLREGQNTQQLKEYYLHEEEVLRAGTRISQHYQRTRWFNGKIFNWLGVRKQTGRGEGSSNLAFDQLVDIENIKSDDSE